MKYGRFWFVSVVRWIWIRSVCDNATMPIPEMTKLSSVCSTLEHKHDIRCLCCYRNYSFGHNWIRHSHTNLFWLLLNAQKTPQSADVWWKMLFQEQLTPNKNTKSIWQLKVLRIKNAIKYRQKPFCYPQHSATLVPNSISSIRNGVC